MWGCGSTTVICASVLRSFFCSRKAAYMPTYPPPTTRILVGFCLLTDKPCHKYSQTTGSAPSHTGREGGTLDEGQGDAVEDVVFAHHEFGDPRPGRELLGEHTRDD